jgi:hypothetical protein
MMMMGGDDVVDWGEGRKNTWVGCRIGACMHRLAVHGCLGSHPGL